MDLPAVDAAVLAWRALFSRRSLHTALRCPYSHLPGLSSGVCGSGGRAIGPIARRSSRGQVAAKAAYSYVESRLLQHRCVLYHHGQHASANGSEFWSQAPSAASRRGSWPSGQLFMLAGAQVAYRCCEHLIRVYRCCVPAPQHRPECTLVACCLDGARYSLPRPRRPPSCLPTHPLRRTPHTCTRLAPFTGTVIAIDVQLSWSHTARPTLDQP